MFLGLELDLPGKVLWKKWSCGMTGVGMVGWGLY